MTTRTAYLVNSNQYPFAVWEDWIEQAQMYPADPKQGRFVPNAQAAAASHQLHGSVREPKAAEGDRGTARRPRSELQQGREAAGKPAETGHLRGGPAKRRCRGLPRRQQFVESQRSGQGSCLPRGHPISGAGDRSQSRLDRTGEHQRNLHEPSGQFH